MREGTVVLLSAERGGDGRRGGPREEAVVLLSAERGGRGAAALGRALVRLSKRFLARLRLDDVELSLALVGDEEIRRLNLSWRRRDQATDVLSFPAGEPPGPGRKLLGDVVISLDTARRVARARRSPLDRELARYLAHGLLHLLGHDHHRPADARRMRALEDALLGHEGLLARSRVP